MGVLYPLLTPGVGVLYPLLLRFTLGTPADGTGAALATL